MKSVTAENGARARSSKSDAKANGAKSNGVKTAGSKPLAGAAIGAKARRDANVLLSTLIAFKRGNFSVRMPVDQTDLEGKIADALNDILELNQKMVSEFERISRAVGKDGKITQRASIGSVTGAWADCVESVNSLIGDLVQPSTEVARVIGAVAKGDLSQNHVARSGRAPAARRVSAHGARGQHHGGAVEFVRVRSNSRGARSGDGRQAGRPGGGDRRGGNVEGSDGERQLDGQQPDQSGAQHRGRDHGRGQGRFDDANHGGRARRNSGAEEHHQHHGGSAQLVRRRSNARGARSGNRRHAWADRRK